MTKQEDHTFPGAVCTVILNQKEKQLNVNFAMYLQEKLSFLRLIRITNKRNKLCSKIITEFMSGVCIHVTSF